MGVHVDDVRRPCGSRDAVRTHRAGCTDTCHRLRQGVQEPRLYCREHRARQAEATARYSSLYLAIDFNLV